MMAADDDSLISLTIGAFKFARSNSKRHTYLLVRILWLAHGGALCIFSSTHSISHLKDGK